MPDYYSKAFIRAIPPDKMDSARNLVPAKQEKALSDNRTISGVIANETFHEFLHSLAEACLRHSTKPEMRQRRAKAVKMRKYLEGDYLGYYDQLLGWRNLKNEGDGIYFEPAMASFVANVVSVLIKTAPKPYAQPRLESNRTASNAAHVAQMLLEMEEVKDPLSRQIEWKWNMICGGETYRLTYFDPTKAGKGYQQEQFFEKTREAEMAAYCPLCDWASGEGERAEEQEMPEQEMGENEEGEASAGPQIPAACPQCGNKHLDIMKAGEQAISVFGGTSYTQVGDVCTEICDPLEMIVIGDCRDIKDALMVSRNRIIQRALLEEALGVENLPKTEIPEMLIYKRDFNPSFFDDEINLPALDMLHYQEVWVAPCIYSSFKFKEDVQTIGGEVIKRGTKLIDIFPEGFYFSRVGKQITEIYEQRIQDVWTHTVNEIGSGFYGVGEWDLLELQDHLTDAKSMKMNSMLFDSTQPMLLRGGYIDAESFENKFGLILPVDPSYPLESPLNNLVDRVRASSPPAEAYQLGEEIKGQMQQRVGAFSTASDAPDIRAMGTATGIAALSEHSLGRRIPSLQLYAMMEVECAYQALEARQRYWPPEMLKEILKDVSDEEVADFYQSDIRRDVVINVEESSWMPKLELQRQQAFEAFMRSAGAAIAAKQSPEIVDELLRQAVKTFGVDFDFADIKATESEARIRLEVVRRIAREMESIPGALTPEGDASAEAIMQVLYTAAEQLKLKTVPEDTMDLYASLPIDSMFDAHEEYQNFYSDWLMSAEGRNETLFVRNAIRALAKFHLEAQFYKEMRLKSLMNAASIPDEVAKEVAQRADAENQQAIMQSTGQPPPTIPEE